MKFTFLKNKSALSKLFRAHGYIVSLNSYVYTDKYPEFDLTDYYKENAITCYKERQMRKKRGAKHTHDSTPVSKLKKELANKRNAYALSLAKNINDLYKSRYGGIDINSNGGVEHVEYLYAKSYGFPAKWKNAGVMICPSEQKIKVYDYRSNLVATYKLPKYKELQKRILGDFELECAYAKKSTHGAYKLYDNNDKLICLSKKMPAPDGDGQYWEHGKDIDTINEEYQNKVSIYNKELAEAALTKKITRAKSLAKHLVNNLCVTYEDARAVGYCEAGVNNFINKHLAGKREVKISVLKRFHQTSRLIEYMCEKVVKQRFA